MRNWLQLNPLSAMAFGLTLLALTFAFSACESDQALSDKSLHLVVPATLSEQYSKDDFAFPSRPPRLSMGKQVFAQNCSVCHVQKRITYNQIRQERPIDTYLMLTRGDKHHKSFKDTLTRDERWEAVFYARYIAGDGSYVGNKPKYDALFGANCAVCHGKKGNTEGTLHTGNGGHDLGMAPVKGAFYPPPANFTSYSRMYNRYNDRLVKHIEEGIYPSAMPSFLGRVYDKETGAQFDEATITELVKYVRGFSYENDLPNDEPLAPPPAEKPAKHLSQTVSENELGEKSAR